VIHDQSSSGATLFIEPLAVVERNNRYRELQLAERDEIRRVLHAMSQRVAENAQALLMMVEALADLDLACMCAKYAEDMQACEPVLLPIQSQPNKDHPGSSIQLLQARHPLLDAGKVVPIDVELDDETFALVITGPNTGGKTVTLKTVGLLALMAQSGLQIPALSGSKISIFKDIFADIGDEQSIEQSLSTFSGHVIQLVSILKQADSKSLELKAYAHTTAGVVNASVEFDLKTLEPTYHLTIGLPGRSNALAIAERLGLPQEIVASARSEINPADLRAEDLLDEIHRQRDLARQSRLAADEMRQQAEDKREEIAMRLEKIEDERIQILEQVRQQAEGEVQKLRDDMENLRHELARARQPLDIVDEVEEVIEELEVEVAQPVERKSPTRKTRPPSGPLRLGEKVHLKSIDQDGVVTSLGENDVEVQVGVLRVRARQADVLRKVPSEENEIADKPVTKRAGKTSLPSVDSPGVELDIRGQRVDDALDELQQYIERAYMAGLPYVRIIHGKGTGKLRLATREALRQSPHVSSWQSGGSSEGGDGVTVAKIRED